MLTCVILAVSLAVSSACANPDATDTNTVLIVSGPCDFHLKADNTPRDNSSEREDWAAIKQDIKSAEKYVDGFWRRHWQECFDGVKYVKPALRGIYTMSDPPSCGSYVPDTSNNAFYCRVDHSVIYGDMLMRQAVERGDALAYLIVAHEWGHAIQELLEGNDGYSRSVSQRRELQADCFAGAALWGSDYEGYFEWQAGDSREAAKALEQIADDTEWTYETPTGDAAHGDALERAGFFQRGRDLHGVRDCFDMVDSDPGKPSIKATAPIPSPTRSKSLSGALIDARGHEESAWASPTGNIMCGASGTDDDVEVRCDIIKKEWKSPPRPDDCPVAMVWGRSLAVSANESIFVCANDPPGNASPGSEGTWWWQAGDPKTTDQGLAALSWGTTILLSDTLRCVSLETGMRCDDTDSEHGFRLSRASYDLS